MQKQKGKMTNIILLSLCNKTCGCVGYTKEKDGNYKMASFKHTLKGEYWTKKTLSIFSYNILVLGAMGVRGSGLGG